MAEINIRSVFILRHAKAEKGMAGTSDIDRPLHPVGVSESNLMAQQLLSHEHLPDCIITSHASRAASTALIFFRILNLNEERFLVRKSIYEASADDLSDLIMSLDDKIRSVMLVGHNPSMTWLASQADPKINHIPTGGIVRLDISIKSWVEFKIKNCSAGLFIHP
jgi:phosphohistidine phosphatase